MNAMNPAVTADATQATTPDRFAAIGTATYSPDDNKLRLYPFARLDAETYARVKDAGFRWAPRQELFVAPAWTPARQDLLIELCGELDDDDTSLVDRAEDRADRFEGYSASRTQDANAARDAVAAIADGIPLGQPILVGHHSERRARKDAERITNGMRRAVKMWETAAYWESRAAGALRHAKYKELPAVRHRRIKVLEAEQRKYQRTKTEADSFHADWSAEALTPEAALVLANYGHIYRRYPLAEYPRPEGASQYEGETSLWSALSDGIINHIQARAIVLPIYARSAAHAARWIEHFDNRLRYERAMLAEQIGATEDAAGNPMAGRFDFQVGGQVLVGGEWAVILRINKAGDTINSLTTTAPKSVHWQQTWNHGVETVKDYKAPAAGDTEKVKAATKLPPLCNYDGEGFRHMTKAEWSARHQWSDFSYVKAVPATETAGRHRIRQMPAGGFKTQQVFITDMPLKAPPKPSTSPAPTIAPAHRIDVPVVSVDRPARAQADANAAAFDAMRQTLKAGVQVVAVPQLFATSPALAARVVEIAQIEEGDTLLEPSAGTGALLDAVGVPVVATAVEINHQLCERLRQRFSNVLTADFLECGPELGQFRRIVMNPPFAGLADVDHVRHAFGMLAPGGRLVAIMGEGAFFRSDRKAEGFRAWLDQIGGTSERLPEGSFKDAGTSVAARLVVIDALQR